jgi:hypothetical protein
MFAAVQSPVMAHRDMLRCRTTFVSFGEGSEDSVSYAHRTGFMSTRPK